MNTPAAAPTKVNPLAREMVAKRMQFVQDDIRSRHSLLMTWLVLGNVAGLYFVLDRATAGTLPRGVDANGLYLTFLIGAGAAFLALLWGLFIGIGVLHATAWIWALQINDTMTAEADNKAVRHTAAIKRAAGWLTVSHFLTAASVLAFVWGLSAPLRLGIGNTLAAPTSVSTTPAPSGVVRDSPT